MTNDQPTNLAKAEEKKNREKLERIVRRICAYCSSDTTCSRHGEIVNLIVAIADAECREKCERVVRAVEEDFARIITYQKSIASVGDQIGELRWRQTESLSGRIIAAARSAAGEGEREV